MYYTHECNMDEVALESSKLFDENFPEDLIFDAYNDI